MAKLRNPVIRFIVCFLCCVLMILYNVLYPLVLPTQAIATEAAIIAAAVIQSLLISLGIGISQDPSGTVGGINSIVEGIGNTLKDSGEMVSVAFDHVKAAASTAWDGISAFASNVEVNVKDWDVLMNTTSAWVAAHLVKPPSGSTEPPKITVETGGTGGVYLNKADAYHGDLTAVLYSFDNKEVDETAFGALAGKSLLFIGRKSGITFKAFNNGDPVTRTSLSCADFGGNGTHCHFFYADANGKVINVPSYCSECKDGYLPNFIMLSFYHNPDKYPYDFLSAVDRFLLPCIKEDGSQNANVGGCRYPTYRINFTEPIQGISTGVAVPVKEDARYAPGVVSGAWQAAIDKLGAPANLLPFNFPMTDTALRDATAADVLPQVIQQEISVSIPAEGEISLPKVDDLKLPNTIITKFPFCIPFDVVNGVKLLVADPVRPEFRVPLKIRDPYSGKSFVDHDIVLNFDRFDFIIRIFRWLQTIGFTILLAANTRKFIKW